MTTYQTNLEHLLDELRRIDFIVGLHCRNYKTEHGERADGFQGLFISDDEINTILNTHPYSTELYPDAEFEKIDALAEQIGLKKFKTQKEGKNLRLQTFMECFHLSNFEIDALLICLAPELDLRYEKLYSYLQNDVTRKRPTVELVMRLLCYSLEEKFEARKYFLLTSPLIRNRILLITGDDQLPLLSRSIRIDERIISFLLEISGIDQRIRNFTALIEPKRSFDDIISTDDNKNILLGFIKLLSSAKNPVMFFFQGPYGSGKKLTAEAICLELETPLLIIDSKGLKGNESFETLKLIIREAMLQNSSLYFEDFDALLEKDSKASVPDLIQYVDSFPNLIFLSGETALEPRGIHAHSFIRLDFTLPSFHLRKQLWKSFLDGCDDVDIDALSSKFKLSGGQIRDAIFAARNLAMSGNGGSKLSMEHLYLGCRAQSNKNLSAFAKKIEPHHTWDDIVLPKDIREQLKEVSGYIKHKGTVYTDWGFDNKLSLGKGLNILFSGPSGTGKTMAAGVIANDAGLDLYKIDLSCVVSKYIGETEKNLRNIFKEAETSNAILFFDEADALFGRRSEIRDSHDRYANIEINYLLQKMEEFEGIVILASNFKKNIDEAFLRRMHFAIEFPLPEEMLREKIWGSIFPKETPVGEDLDFSFLSKLKITGGNIKNIALSAAFLAAENSGSIKMEHIIRATKREFQKMGKLCVKGDFGKYYEMLESEGIKNE